MNQNRLLNHRLSNLLHTILLLSGMIAILGLLGYLLGGTSGVLWATLLGGLLLYFSGNASPHWVLRIYGARPVAMRDAPGLYQIVNQLARRAGLPSTPRLYLLRHPAMNAFAVGTRAGAAIGVTEGILQRMNRREIAGILAHEISHIQHNDMRVMMMANVVGRMTRFLATFGGLLLFLNLPLLMLGMAAISWPAILLLLAAPTLNGLLHMALSRSREFDADLGAVRLSGDPAGLASALYKLEHYQNSGLFGIFFPGRSIPQNRLLRTHPLTEERVQRLQDISGEALPAPLFPSETGVRSSGRPQTGIRWPGWRIPGAGYSN